MDSKWGFSKIDLVRLEPNDIKNNNFEEIKMKQMLNIGLNPLS